jgi:lipopolysaccharide biosynthesis protein
MQALDPRRDSDKRVRCLAFYLPQFYPIPENDIAWGKGFTEWTNVARARPAFPGHYQPHLPRDLGFYDLRLEETRVAQADLAVRFGVHGFVYYHYWFKGRQVLDTPFREVLRSGVPHFPFCLAWANENWTRAWDGNSAKVIIRQSYSKEDDLAHIRSLRRALLDDRYVRWDGKPILLVYRAGQLPKPQATAEIWREEAASWGLPGLYLLRVESFPDECGDPTDLGFDAAVEFQPRWWAEVQDPVHLRAANRARTTFRAVGPFRHRVRSYRALVESEMVREPISYIRWPCVCPGWDNSPRRKKDATIFVGNSPQIYRQWLTVALRKALNVADAAGRTGDALVFVNAWNEWGEGNHLEPDMKYGLSFLHSHHLALQQLTLELSGQESR